MIKMEEILTWIYQADDYEINEMLTAISRRYDAVFPDWEVIFLSLPKHDPAERERLIEMAVNWLKQDSRRGPDE